jgi:uncharacterized membrane protein YhaH (DUF805 family)
MDPNAVVDVFRRTITEHYVDFQGRVARRDFWYYVLAYFVCYIVLAIIQSIIGIGLLTLLFSLGLLLPSLGVAVRRLHDIDRSGWWILIGVVPGFLAGLLSVLALMTGSLGFGMAMMGLVGLVALGAAVLLIYWYAQPGTAGDNQFGAPPTPMAPTPSAPA